MFSQKELTDLLNRNDCLKMQRHLCRVGGAYVRESTKFTEPFRMHTERARAASVSSNSALQRRAKLLLFLLLSSLRSLQMIANRLFLQQIVL